MSGFWVTLYENLTESKVTGYLYCCNTCTNVIRVKSKTEKQNCPKCGDLIVEAN